MQLAEEGKLALNVDINQYLEDFQIPDTYEEPVTMRNLMTHSAGFEDYWIGFSAKDSTGLRPMGEYLADHLPARVRPPGKYISYSNHGAGIAAYIVEQLSGQSFEDYVDQHIFGPLHMNQSTFRQPLPGRFRQYMAKGYSFQRGMFKENEYEYMNLGAVGAASTTAADMINFMKAHLQYGQYADTTIMDSTTAKKMQSPIFRHNKAVAPMRYGFLDYSQNGVEIIGHGGSWSEFKSNMALFPKHDLGIFYSFNRDGSVIKKLLEDFTDYYFPEGNLSADTLDLGKEQLKRFTGNYRTLRLFYENFTYLLEMDDPFPVTATEDGKLRTMNNEAKIWFPVDSLRFRNTKNSNVIVFEENEEEEITHMFWTNPPHYAFEKVPFISSQKLHFALFHITGAAFLLTLVYWPLVFGIRRKYRPEMTGQPPLSLPKKALAWFNSLIVIIFLVLVVLPVLNNSPFGINLWSNIEYGVSTGFKAALVLPLISVFLTLGMGFYTYMIWQKKESDIWSRIWYSLLFLLSLTIIWQFYYWNLLGFQY